MGHPRRTIVILKPGTVLTDAQREDLLAKAIKTRFHEQFSKMPPDDAEKIARALARELVNQSNACAERHLQSDLGRRLELTAPNAEECESLAELADEVIEFRYRKEPPRGSKAYRAVKKASGVMWLNLRRALGLPDLPPEVHTGSVTGPRG